MSRGERRVEAVLLVHGALSGPWIFEGWQSFFPEVTVSAVDLQVGLKVESASMELFVGTLVAEAGRLPFPLVVCGWDMGGLVALMAAEQLRPHSLLLLEPDPPAEILGFHPEISPVDGAYTAEPEEFPPDIRSRPDSLRARLERERGISVPSIPGPSLVVYGDEFLERARAIARLYGSEELHLPGLSHWDLVLNPGVPQAVARRVGLGP